MKNTQTIPSKNNAAAKIALIVLLSCWSLFYLDHETSSFTDLFNPGNLAALAIYFIPAFLLVFFLFEKLRHKKSQATSLLLASAIGIPVSFVLIISCFLIFW